MSKKFQLKIADPCHENWDAMSPDEKGRFCGSCQKQVVDFSEMSDRQIAAFFKKPSTGSVCGRFMTDQLERTIEMPKKRIPWARYFFQITLPAFLFSMKTNAQKKRPMTEKAATADTLRKPIENFDSRTLGMIALIDDFKKDTIVEPLKLPDTIKGEVAVKVDTIETPPVCTPIMGTIAYVPEKGRSITVLVVDEFGAPVADVFIANKKNNERFLTSDDGKTMVPVKLFSKDNRIVVSAAGFSPVEIKGGSEQYQSGQVIIQLKPIQLDEVVVSAEVNSIRSATHLTGYVNTVPKEEITLVTNHKKTAEVDEKQLVVYPNPLKAGASIHLAFNKLPEGYYRCQLTNTAGQDVWKQEIWIDKDARLLTIDVPHLIAGSYFLVLSGVKSSARITEKIIVQ